MPESSSNFPIETAGLTEARAPEVVELRDGSPFHLHIGPVAKRIGEANVRMLAYNGSIPGPTIRVRQGSKLQVSVLNEGDLEATVHWHGLRLDNRYDGTTHTQQAIPIGGSFTYVLEFPDPGVYWYHPHIREDYGQELGLYGNIVVVPTDQDYWPPVNRELAVTLDDILLEHGRVARFLHSETTHVAMGRFGNVMLVNGEPELSLASRRGEVVRFYLTNAANTRIFDVRLPGARMKLVGGDSGRREREEFVEHMLLAPSERVVVDVMFGEPGVLKLEHHTPDRSYPLATITVSDEAAQPSLASQFVSLRTNSDMVAERARIAPYLLAEPDKTVALVAEMEMGEPDLRPGTVASYVCPMHPEVTRDAPGKCPKCAMKLVPADLMGKKTGDHHDHGHAHGHDRGHGKGNGHSHGHVEAAHPPKPAGIEWEDDMAEVNRITTPSNMRWKLVDRATGTEGMGIDWRFRVGDQVKIRVVNEMDSDHPMPHPFHVHGAGRFLVLSRDGVTEPNLVWKDTVLVETGQTVDILLDVTHPGLWMAHCHIAEHHESGMMLMFRVDPA